MKTEWSFPRGASLAVVLVLTVSVFLAVGSLGDQSQPMPAWSRTLEPVILTGRQLRAFDGARGDQLFAYAYRNGSWLPIPFQFDEVTTAGGFSPEDGLLDANDELVFMAADMGQEASPFRWVGDAQSRLYPRYEIRTTDPLSPTQRGWVYVYRSPTLQPPSVKYVSWYADNNRIVGGTYVLGFAPTVHAGADSLELNGSGVDALDRTEIRIYATCHLPFPFPVFSTVLTENDLTGLGSEVPSVVGPVRLGGGWVGNSAWSYRSIFEIGTEADITSFQAPAACNRITIEAVRFSNDWLNPADTGMAPATYYDDNTLAGVAIDGIPDLVATLPANAWKQISGGQGSIVEVTDVVTGGGALSNYYKDDSTYDPQDTGDHQSFGNAGYRVDNPSGIVGLKLMAYVLDPGLPNVGATYRSDYDNPLRATTTQQGYACSEPQVAELWPTAIQAGSVVTFTAVVTGGQAPFTYTWAFGDDGKIGMGTPVSHTFEETGTFPVTLTVASVCETNASATERVTVTSRITSPE
jgi:hypothetical protein